MVELTTGLDVAIIMIGDGVVNMCVRDRVLVSDYEIMAMVPLLAFPR